MTDPTAITAYQLAELLKKVDAHIGRNSGYPAITGVHFDYDGQYLHAAATDRYTFAIARQKIDGSDVTWSGTISAHEDRDDLAVLASWVNSRSGEEIIHLTPVDGALTVDGFRSTLTVPLSDGHFPEWRDIVRTALHAEPTESPFSGFSSKMLARWETAGFNITTWQAAFDKPVVVYGHNFVGLQMPRKISGDESPESRWEEWRSSLGDEGPKVAQAQTLNHWESVDLEEKENAVGGAAADLLKQVLRSTTDVFKAATDDPAAIVAYGLAGGSAWLAYRLLKALEKADPDLLQATLADTNEQLESGEIGEWAWDEAEKAGHDPQEWHDDYVARLKSLAAKKSSAA